MSRVVQSFFTCTKCQKKYNEWEHKQLPQGPDKVFGAKGNWPTCNTVLAGGEICGNTNFAGSDDSDDDE